MPKGTITAGTKEGRIYLGKTQSNLKGALLLGLTKIEEDTSGGDVENIAADDNPSWMTIVKPVVQEPKFTLKTLSEELKTATGFETFSGSTARINSGKTIPVNIAFITTVTDTDKVSTEEIHVYYNLTLKQAKPSYETGTSNAADFVFESTASNVDFIDTDGKKKSGSLLTINETDPIYTHVKETLFGDLLTGDNAQLMTPQDIADYKKTN